MKRAFLLLAIALILPACSGGGDKSNEVPCTDDELWDQVAQECVARFRSGNSATDGGNNSTDMSDPAPDMSDAGSDPVDMEPDAPPTEECDKDRDGVASEECGGMDCNDEDSLQSPRNPEFCDNLDNNCNGVNNEGLNCTFYAHSGQELYVIDPFALTIEEVGTDLPNLQDIDTHPNGTLLGVTFDGLYEFDELRDNWFSVGDFGTDVSDPNGMAIDSTGRIFVTSQNQIYEVDIVDGSATLLGDLGQDFYSSGDCVVNKRDSLYMTSKHDETEDHLLLVNRDNGSASDVGPIGFTHVFALTAAWGTLYGLTDNGELIEIDSDTGTGTLVHQYTQGEPPEAYRFYGAASTPSR